MVIIIPTGPNNYHVYMSLGFNQFEYLGPDCITKIIRFGQLRFESHYI